MEEEMLILAEGDITKVDAIKRISIANYIRMLLSLKKKTTQSQHGT